MGRSIPENSGAIRSRVVKQTGPRTARGKAASSQNARKHGLRSKDVVIVGEDPKELEELLGDLREDLTPVGALEEELVEHVANAHWRLRRARRIEAGMYADHMDRKADIRRRTEEAIGYAPNDYTTVSSTYASVVGLIDTILRYETTIRRSMYRDLDQLKKLRAERIENLNAVDVTAEVEPVEVAVSPDLLGDLDL